MDPSHTLIRGFIAGTVGCPNHGSMCVWTAVTDSGPRPVLEVVKYSCGCIYSWERDVMGAPSTLEHDGWHHLPGCDCEFCTAP